MSAAASDLLARIDTVCLDLDGTLIDTVSGWHAAFDELWPELLRTAPGLVRLGSSAAAYDDYLRGYMHEAHIQAGEGEWSDDFVRAAFRRLLALDGESHDEAGNVFADRYIAGANEHMQLFPDVANALGRLRERARLGLISNGLVRDQEAKIERTSLAQYFDAIVISEAVDLRKPDPAIFLHTLERLGAGPERALYAGDNAEHDVGGARAAGMLAVWVHRGDQFYGATEEADITVANLDELSELLTSAA